MDAYLEVSSDGSKIRETTTGSVEVRGRRHIRTAHVSGNGISLIRIGVLVQVNLT